MGLTAIMMRVKIVKKKVLRVKFIARQSLAKLKY